MRNILNYNTAQDFEQHESVTTGECIVRLSFSNEYDTDIEEIFVGDNWYRVYNNTYTGPYTFAPNPVQGKMWGEIVDVWKVTADGIQEDLYAYRDSNETRYYSLYIQDSYEEGIPVFRYANGGSLYRFVSCEEGGGVSSVIPGIAYCRENEGVYYQFPERVEFSPSQFPSQGTTFVSWADAGIRPDNFNKYRRMSLCENTHVDNWNLFVNIEGNKEKVIQYGYNARYNTVELVVLNCRYYITIGEEGFYIGNGCLT